jgi:hypothetical protein
MTGQQYDKTAYGLVAGIVLVSSVLLGTWLMKKPPATHTARYLVVVSTKEGLMSTSVVVSNKTAIVLNEQLVEDLRQYVMRVVRTTNAVLVNVIRLEERHD